MNAATATALDHVTTTRCAGNHSGTVQLAKAWALFTMLTLYIRNEDTPFGQFMLSIGEDLSREDAARVIKNPELYAIKVCHKTARPTDIHDGQTCTHIVRLP